MVLPAMRVRSLAPFSRSARRARQAFWIHISKGIGWNGRSGGLASVFVPESPSQRVLFRAACWRAVRGSLSDSAPQGGSEIAVENYEDTTIPQTILSFIPTNVFSDLAGTRSTSTIAVVIFSAIVGMAYLKLRDRDSEQADLFRRIIDSLYGIVMCIVKMVIGLTPYGVMALIANVMATSDFAAIVDLGKFIIFSYVAIIAMFVVHLVILAANRVNPVTYLKKAFPVLSFAFVSRTSAGALPMNIETQSKALGVDETTANFAASFGMSIGQNGCAGIYPAMMATLIAPTVGINVFDPTWVVMLIAIIVISSFGVAGVGGGATFASLIVLGTMGLPIEIVGLMASVEPLIDMGRTALNVSDSMVAGVTSANVNKTLDREMFANPEARISGSAAEE